MASDKVKTHGNFADVAKLTQELKDIIQVNGADSLNPASREALDQIITRISRIVVGDESHPKHWADIAGLAMAKLETLKPKEITPPPVDIERDIRRLAREIPQRNDGDAQWIGQSTTER